MSNRLPNQFADFYDLSQVDRALTLVNGHRAAAAKLIDMEPNKLRNLVNYHPCLKKKWGKGSRGRRPGKNLNLLIKPYVESPPVQTRGHLHLFVELLDHLGPHDLLAIKKWFEWRFGGCKKDSPCIESKFTKPIRNTG